MTNPWIFYCETEEEWEKIALEDLKLCIKEVLRTQKECRLGLAGGSTPLSLYKKLAEEDLPWEKIKMIQLDERFVPSDDKASNLNMLRKTLFSRAPLPPENILAFDTSLPYESAAQEMNRKLLAMKQEGRPLLDCLILGAGSDGHIASLFEGDLALQSREYACTATAKGTPSPQRLTLSIQALQEASCAILLLKGPEKAPLIQAMESSIAALPLTALKALLPKVKIKVLAYLHPAVL
jgi:6-phosphogluconolactonase